MQTSSQKSSNKKKLSKPALSKNKKTKSQVLEEPKPPFPKTKQKQPGLEATMSPRPRYEATEYKAAGKLENKVALITGGDSGIGRAVAYLYAREGANVAITALPEERVDAEETAKAIKKVGRECLILEGDLTEPEFCKDAVERTLEMFGSLDILVSNAAHQTRSDSIEEVSLEEWERTFRTNVTPYFLLSKAAIPHMKPGSCIIATASEQAAMASSQLANYASTKGAIVSFTRALAQQLIEKGIRVNAVAPGPVWTPLNPSDPGQPEEKVATFGSQNPSKRPAQPEELSPAYVFLASDADSSYISGAVLPVMGAEPSAGL